VDVKEERKWPVIFLAQGAFTVCRSVPRRETPAEEPAEPETDLLPDTGTEEGAGGWQQTVIYGKA